MGLGVVLVIRCRAKERDRLERGQKDSPQAGVSQDGNRIPQFCRWSFLRHGQEGVASDASNMSFRDVWVML